MSGLIRFGLVGLGRHGESHLNNLLKIPNTKIVGICVKNITKERKQLAKQLGCSIYNDFYDLVNSEDIDAMIISVPNHLHHQMVEACAKKNIDVLLEKPIADTIKNAKKIVKVVRKYKINLLVGYHRRFSPKVKLLKELLIKQKIIGDIIGANILWAICKPESYFYQNGNKTWQAKKKCGGGPILINVSHEIDTLRFIFGEPKNLSAITTNKNRKFDVEDTMVAMLRFKNDIIVNIFASDCVPSCFSYENTVEENNYYYKYDKNSAYFFGSKGTLLFPSFEFMHHLDERGWDKPIFIENLSKNLNEDPLLNELQHFCRVVRKEEQALIDVEDGFKTFLTATKLSGNTSF